MERFDKVLKNCRVLDVRTGGVGKADIAFGNGLIAAVGENLGDGEDCGGLFALPGFIDAHNVVCAGDSDADMRLAINSLLSMGGGICAVKDGKLALSLALPVAGLMSCAPAEQTAAKMTAINDFCKKQLRVDAEAEPVMALSFLALTVIPHACLTDRGLFDADKFRFIQDAAV